MKFFDFLFASLSTFFNPVCAESQPAHLHEFTTPSVMVIVGTDRPDSQTRTVAENLAAAYQQKGMATSLYDVADFSPELYAPTAYAERPADFKKFNDELLKTDVVVIVSPEYNAAIPAPLMRVINLLSFPDSFTGKKFVIVTDSVSSYGATRAHEQLKKTLLDLHAVVDDALNLKIAHVDQVTKAGSSLYAEHAEKLAHLQK